MYFILVKSILNFLPPPWCPSSQIPSHNLIWSIMYQVQLVLLCIHGCRTVHYSMSNRNVSICFLHLWERGEQGVNRERGSRRGRQVTYTQGIAGGWLELYWEHSDVLPPTSLYIPKVSASLNSTTDWYQIFKCLRLEVNFGCHDLGTTCCVCWVYHWPGGC